MRAGPPQPRARSGRPASRSAIVPRGRAGPLVPPPGRSRSRTRPAAAPPCGGATGAQARERSASRCPRPAWSGLRPGVPGRSAVARIVRRKRRARDGTGKRDRAAGADPQSRRGPAAPAEADDASGRRTGGRAGVEPQPRDGQRPRCAPRDPRIGRRGPRPDPDPGRVRTGRRRRSRPGSEAGSWKRLEESKVAAARNPTRRSSAASGRVHGRMHPGVHRVGARRGSEHHAVDLPLRIAAVAARARAAGSRSSGRAGTGCRPWCARAGR